jgi:4-aminobutyrate aminotransferase/(S)-3-amino-2-methylpropionate transaminase
MSDMTNDNLINGIKQERVMATALPGPKSADLQKRRVNAIGAGIGMTLPIFVERAGGGIIVDIDGNSIIDMGAGIAVTNVGNAAPEVVEAVKEQVERFTHTCFMVSQYESYVEVCELLNRLTPGDHAKKSILVNTGAEALENAVKIARLHTKRQAVVVFEHGYHGRTNLTMAMTGKNMPYKQGFGPLAPEIYRMPMSYPFHDGGLSGEQAAARTISRIEKELGASNVAAIVIEPIQGEGGFVVPAEGFLPALVKFARDNGIVFVADEVQTGFCRTGQWFACNHEGIVPDLITTAKGIAGGLPLAAVTGRAEIMDSVHPGGLGGTYGGNPLACAAAVASIKVMERDNLNAKAAALGTIMKPRLEKIANDSGVIGEVRGRGAMIAVEITKPGTDTPDPDMTNKVAKFCHDEGVLVLTAGTYSNVLRFLPPLVMPDHLLEDALQIIERAFKEATA